ncbi:hypothetical protein T01_5504 [Trichinella spiralis]|uniref:Uncharacterized protein n=1 Tax=Trichinella spiralis TaxID=6334 RepID=A0A0V1BCF1_TRISP|nr:hypothetical protein T01_5504 [Trichinella spiralis]
MDVAFLNFLEDEIEINCKMRNKFLQLENNKLQIYENSKFSNSIEQENMRMLYKKKHQCPTFLNWHIIPLLEQKPIYAEYEQNCLFSEDKNGHMLITAIL